MTDSSSFDEAYEAAERRYLDDHPPVKHFINAFTTFAEMGVVTLPTDEIWLKCPRGHRMWTVRVVAADSGRPVLHHLVPVGEAINGKILLTNNSGAEDGGDVNQSIHHFAGARSVLRCQDQHCRYRCVTHTLAVHASVFAALIGGQPHATVLETREQWTRAMRA